MGVKRRWPVLLVAFILAVSMGCQTRPTQQSASLSLPAASSEPSSAPEASVGASEASEEAITVPEPIQPVAKPVEVPAVLPESSEAQLAPKPESQSASAFTVLPSPETVVWLVEKQVFSLSEVAKNPWGTGGISGYFENNSTEPVTLSVVMTLEHYDGANWVQVEYSGDAMPNWPTGNGPTPPGARLEMRGMSWGLYMDNLVPGQYRWVKWIDSSYSQGADFEAFCIYAAFELV